MQWIWCEALCCVCICLNATIGSFARQGMLPWEWILCTASAVLKLYPTTGVIIMIVAPWTSSLDGYVRIINAAIICIIINGKTSRNCLECILVCVKWKWIIRLGSADHNQLSLMGPWNRRLISQIIEAFSFDNLVERVTYNAWICIGAILWIRFIGKNSTNCLSICIYIFS